MAKATQASKKSEGSNEKRVATNKRATFDYHIEDRFEAGLVLHGSEVKSLRNGKGSIAEAYASIDRGEAWLEGAHIDEYTPASRFNHAPRRRRKLLLSRKQLDKLETKVSEKGYTLVPLSLYFRNGWAKLEIGLGKGKKQYDKREDIKKREHGREMERERHR
jgi:SsrA-binding protein